MLMAGSVPGPKRACPHATTMVAGTWGGMSDDDGLEWNETE